MEEGLVARCFCLELSAVGVTYVPFGVSGVDALGSGVDKYAEFVPPDCDVSSISKSLEDITRTRSVAARALFSSSRATFPEC